MQKLKTKQKNTQLTSDQKPNGLPSFFEPVWLAALRLDTIRGGHSAQTHKRKLYMQNAEKATL